MENENEMQEVKIKVKGEIELVKFDIEPYLGKKVKIENVKTMKSQFGYCVKLETEKLGEWEDTKGDIKEVRANRIFSLQEDKEGNIGWGEKTQLGLFLKKHKINSLDELKGLEVITQSVTKKDGDFLRFN